MAIDRIGKGSPPLPTPDAQGAQGPSATTKTGKADAFKVERANPTTQTGAAERAGAAQGADGVEASSPLGRLRSGEVDVHGYIDLKVDEATGPLQGLSPAELDEIKSVLRDQMRSDPGLADLVRTATGSMPSPPED